MLEIGKNSIEVAIGVYKSERHSSALERIQADVAAAEAPEPVAQTNLIGLWKICEHGVEIAIAIQQAQRHTFREVYIRANVGAGQEVTGPTGRVAQTNPVEREGRA